MQYNSGRAIEALRDNKISTAAVYRLSSFVSQLFGNTALAGRVRFADAYGHNVVVEERNGVAIDRVYGSVAVGPFNYETVVGGEFPTRIDFKNVTLHSSDCWGWRCAIWRKGALRSDSANRAVWDGSPLPLTPWKSIIRRVSWKMGPCVSSAETSACPPVTSAAQAHLAAMPGAPTISLPTMLHRCQKAGVSRQTR